MDQTEGHQAPVPSLARSLYPEPVRVEDVEGPVLLPASGGKPCAEAWFMSAETLCMSDDVEVEGCPYLQSA